MKMKSKALLSLFLIIWVLFSIFLLINHGPRYIARSYFDSDTFKTKLEIFKEGLGLYVLQPFNVEEAKNQVTVTKEEIDYHRNYYGTLSEQVENIKMQYQDRIENAASDPELQQVLIEELDTKIADIKQNFSDDQHVEEKIRKQKEAIIHQYNVSETERKKDFLNEFGYFSYQLKNTNTGQVYEFGDVNSDAVFKINFGNKTPYLVVNNSRTISSDRYDYTLMNQEIPYEGEISRYEGTITIPKSMMGDTQFKDDYQAFTITKMTLYAIWATALLSIVGLCTIAKPSLKLFLSSNRLKDLFLKLPIDFRFAVIIMAVFIAYLLLSATSHEIVYDYYWGNYIFDLVFHIAFLFIFSALGILGALWIWESLNNEEKVKKEWKRSFFNRLSYGMQNLFLNSSIGLQSILILLMVFFTGIGFVATIVAPILIIIYAPFIFFVGIPSFIVFLSRMGYLNRIMKQTEEMAQGRLTTEVVVKGKSPLAKHAMHLNELQEGVRKSLMEQAKSERLKTELITNVSHDLRTPLTSIITYTDLLKNPDITEEERKHYIEILEKKSARLKTLIEDLFEVSKMSSGNMELHRERIDLTQLLQQAVGEHKESFEKANLDLRVTLPNTPLIAYVDGQKWWRVIDNLIINALKYSLEGTRVYVQLRKEGTIAELSVKNISNYELGDNVEELTERFKRADESRHTDGSGLGLAISQSIVDLHGGTLKIDVDGDLFKVIVTVEVE